MGVKVRRTSPDRSRRNPRLNPRVKVRRRSPARRRRSPDQRRNPRINELHHWNVLRFLVIFSILSKTNKSTICETKQNKTSVIIMSKSERFRDDDDIYLLKKQSLHIIST